MRRLKLAKYLFSRQFNSLQKSPSGYNLMKKFRILAISGSLRKASTNSGLLRACLDINHPRLDIRFANILQIPMFNEDIENPTPQAVADLRKQAAQSVGFLFAVPENNHNMSAPLKNAYDWLSRGADTPMKERPAAMVSSGGGLGGKRGQDGFRTSTGFLKMKMMVEPTVAVQRFAGEFFDVEGNLVKNGVKQELKDFLDHFVNWVEANRFIQ